MTSTLLCPRDAASVPALSRKRAMVLTPFLGRTPVDYALEAIASGGAKEVRIVSEDHADQLREAVGRGEAWGLRVEVTSASPAAAASGGEPAPVHVLDALPQLPGQPLWRSYRDWYSAQRALIPALAPQRVGMREAAPGVFAGLRTQIAPDVKLAGPCWIGANVFIGARAVIGPGVIVEDGSYIDEGAEVVGSIVGPQTYLGGFTELRDSFAWGNELLHLDSGSLTEITDPFLISEIQADKSALGKLIDAVRSLARKEPVRLDGMKRPVR